MIPPFTPTLYIAIFRAYGDVAMRPSRRQILPFTRQWTEGRLTVTATLVGAHVAAYTAQFFVEFLGRDHGLAGEQLWSWLALTGSGIAQGNFWQFASFGCMPARYMPWRMHFCSISPDANWSRSLRRHFLGVFLSAICSAWSPHSAGMPLVGISPVWSRPL
jgi:hypothetical protein